jgi:hypothetical protein
MSRKVLASVDGPVAPAASLRRLNSLVCMSWQAVQAPNRTDVDADRKAVWTYAFRVDNPGGSPISDIKGRVLFPSLVARIRHNGAEDEPDSVLELNYPGTQSSRAAWRRQLRVAAPSPRNVLRRFAEPARNPG